MRQAFKVRQNKNSIFFQNVTVINPIYKGVVMWNRFTHLDFEQSWIIRATFTIG